MYEDVRADLSPQVHLALFIMLCSCSLCISSYILNSQGWYQHERGPLNCIAALISWYSQGGHDVEKTLVLFSFSQ